jgi:tripartite-type tricarboxylate transporter receptor subunit TctC
MAPQRLSGHPTVPTLQELGINDYGYARWSILIANSTADPDMIKKIRKIVSQPEVTERLLELDHRPVKTTPNQLEELSLQFRKIKQRVKFD